MMMLAEEWGWGGSVKTRAARMLSKGSAGGKEGTYMMAVVIKTISLVSF